MRLKILFVAALMALPLMSCTSLGAETKNSACLVFSPIYISKQDVLTDGTARQILTHNLTGQRLGCW